MKRLFLSASFLTLISICSAEPQKWEYHTYSAPAPGQNRWEWPKLDKQLNKLGAEGWELVSVVPDFSSSAVNSNNARIVHYFKRAKGLDAKEEKVQLPETDIPSSLDGLVQDGRLIRLTAKGELVFKKKVISMDDLLKQLSSYNKSDTLHVFCDIDAPFKIAVDTIQRLHKEGFLNVGLSGKKTR